MANLPTAAKAAVFAVLLAVTALTVVVALLMGLRESFDHDCLQFPSSPSIEGVSEGFTVKDLSKGGKDKVCEAAFGQVTAACKDVYIRNKLIMGQPDLGDNTDPYHLQKLVHGVDQSELRLTINDNSDESLQIWGDSCRSPGGCSGPGRMAHKFQADGTAEHVGPIRTYTSVTRDEPLPQGWGGGLHTWDVYANATIGAGSGGQVRSYINSRGDIVGEKVSAKEITGAYMHGTTVKGLEVSGDQVQGGTVKSGTLCVGATCVNADEFAKIKALLTKRPPPPQAPPPPPPKPAPLVILYEHPEGVPGRSIHIRDNGPRGLGGYDLPLRGFNDKTSYIQIGPWTKAWFYKDTKFRGRFFVASTREQGSHVPYQDLRRYDMDDKISSVRIQANH